MKHSNPKTPKRYYNLTKDQRIKHSDKIAADTTDE